MALGIATPSRTGIFDVLLHEDVYPGQQPTVYLYRGLPGSIANPNDPRLRMMQECERRSGGDGVT